MQSSFKRPQQLSLHLKLGISTGPLVSGTESWVFVRELKSNTSNWTVSYLFIYLFLWSHSCYQWLIKDFLHQWVWIRFKGFVPWRADRGRERTGEFVWTQNWITPHRRSSNPWQQTHKYTNVRHTNIRNTNVTHKQTNVRHTNVRNTNVTHTQM